MGREPSPAPEAGSRWEGDAATGCRWPVSKDNGVRRGRCRLPATGLGSSHLPGAPAQPHHRAGGGVGALETPVTPRTSCHTPSTHFLCPPAPTGSSLSPGSW